MISKTTNISIKDTKIFDKKYFQTNKKTASKCLRF
nr:MAG TPA: hypothetical protein [Caudoviricetes sp.]